MSSTSNQDPSLARATLRAIAITLGGSLAFVGVLCGALLIAAAATGSSSGASSSPAAAAPAASPSGETEKPARARAPRADHPKKPAI